MVMYIDQFTWYNTVHSVDMISTRYRFIIIDLSFEIISSNVYSFTYFSLLTSIVRDTETVNLS